MFGIDIALGIVRQKAGTANIGARRIYSHAIVKHNMHAGGLELLLKG